MSPRTYLEIGVTVALLFCAGMWSRSCEREAEARGEAKLAHQQTKSFVDSAATADKARAAREAGLVSRATTAEKSKDSLATAARAQDAHRQAAQQEMAQAAAATADALQALRVTIATNPPAQQALDRYLEAQAVEGGHAAQALAASQARGDLLERALAAGDSARAATDSLYLNERETRQRAQLALNAALVEIGALRDARPSWYHQVVQVAEPIAAAVAGWKARCLIQTCKG